MENGFGIYKYVMVALIVLVICMFVTVWFFAREVRLVRVMYLAYVLPEMNMCIDALVNSKSLSWEDSKTKRDMLISVQPAIEKSKAMAKLVLIESGVLLAAIIVSGAIAVFANLY